MESWRLWLLSYVSKHLETFFTRYCETKCPKAPWPSATAYKLICLSARFVFITRLSWFTLLGLVICTPCRVRYEYFCFIFLYSIEFMCDTDLYRFCGSIDVQLLYRFLALRLWWTPRPYWGLDRVALEMLRLMLATERLIWSALPIFWVRGFLRGTLALASGCFRVGWLRVFYLLLWMFFLVLSWRECCILSTGDRERECLEELSLWTDMLFLVQSMKSCRKRGFSNFFLSSSGFIR